MIRPLVERLQTAAQDSERYVGLDSLRPTDPFFTGITNLLREAAAALGQIPQWQPIASAPKDGDTVLVYAPSYVEQIVPACWDRDKEAEGGQCWRAADAEWDRLQPTHWMPLKAIPLPDLELVTPASSGEPEPR